MSTFWYGQGLDLADLGIRCDGSHAHLPWGRTKEPGTHFATADERNYPDLLCRRIAKRVAKMVGADPAPKGGACVDKEHNHMQPRKGLNELVPEFKEIVAVKGCSQVEMERITAWSKGRCGMIWKRMALTKGHKLLDSVKDGVSGLTTVSIGVPWEPLEFVRQAEGLMHPFDRPVIVPPAVAEAIWRCAVLGPTRLCREREETTRYYKDLSAKLEPDEKWLHSLMNKELEAVVTNKKIGLFKAMLADIGYDDPGVADLLKYGVRIVGLLKRIGIWRPDPTKAPRVSLGALNAGARDAQKSAMAGTDSWTAEDQELWDKTVLEAESDCLHGPLTVEEIEKAMGPYWIPARRFGIMQNDKLRPVDDFSEFDTNAAFGSEEKIDMKNLDQVVAYARAWADAVGSDRELMIRDTSGKVWRGRLHDEWSLEEWTKLVGRVADLKNAYKQLPRNPVDRALSIIAVRRPTGGVALF